MKAQTLLVGVLALASTFSLVACSGDDGKDVKVESTTSQQVKDEGTVLRKPADTSGSGESGNSAKPSPD